MKKIIVIFVFIFLFISGQAQKSNFSIKLIPVSYNPFDTPNYRIIKHKITKDGLLTLEPGLQIGYEIFGNEYTSFKITQSIQYDALSKFMGATQIMLRRRLFKKWKNSVFLGIGPVFYIRQTWQSINGYYPEEYYHTANSIEYYLMWLSGEIEYNYTFKKNSDITISLNHIAPRSFGILIGYKYWFNRKGVGCKTCPSYK